MEPDIVGDDKCERRLYIGNLDRRITEAVLIKMFTPYGEIKSEDFVWHTHGPKRGSPRGFAFIEFSTKEEAKLAKEKMNGRLACGRPLVVRLASDKCFVEAKANPSKGVACEAKKSCPAGSQSGQMSRNGKIAAIKNKLKSIEEENCNMKKPRQAE